MVMITTIIMMMRQTRKLAATRDRVCADCGGKGGTNVKSCTGCKGRGVKIQTIQVGRERVEKDKKPSPPSQMGPGMVQQSQAVCGECDGRGEIIPPSSR